MKNIFSKKQAGRILANHANLLIMLIMVQTFTACNDDTLQDSAQPGGALQINVSAEGFTGSGVQTRASDAGYTTTFAAPDQIGITVIQDGVVRENNIPYRYNGMVWSPVTSGNEVHAYTHGTVTYLVYYPYSTAMDNKTTAADIVVAFTPANDQSAQADYTASDLMTGTGTVSGATLNVTLAHALALVEINLHEGASSPTLKVNGGTALTPYDLDGKYRCIVKPETSAATLSGTFTFSSTPLNWSQAGVNLVAGKYVRLDITGAAQNIEDFGTTTGITTVTDTDLADLQTYLNGLTSGNYVVNLTTDHSFTNTGVVLKHGVKVSLRGNRTITRATGGGGMFYVYGELIIRGVTLSGGNGSGTRPLVSIYATKFTLRSGAITGHSNTLYNGGGVEVTDGATFYMYDGTISNNYANIDGGGVSVGNGTFIMYGGAIKDNNARYSGGGVSVVSGSTFTMTGGTISNNAAGYGGGGGMYSGGGVHVGASGTFTKSGNSIIENNTCTANNGKQVYASGSLWRNTDAGATIRLYKSGAGTSLTTTDSDGFDTAANWNQ